MEEKISEENHSKLPTVSAPILRSYDGVSEIEGWTKLFTRPRPAGQYHPARLWILESTSSYPQFPVQAVYWIENPENPDEPVITISFGTNTIDGRPFTFEQCSFKGQEGSPGESERYINNHYDEPHTSRASTTGKQFNVWGPKTEYKMKPRETIDAFPESANVVITFKPHTSG